MNIYISGISGTGMGPLALMAKQAGMNVHGSDLARGAIYDELVKAGIEVSIGVQDGEFLKTKLDEIDWFVYTSALPEGHAELVLARESGIKCTKRDDFTAYLVDELGLKMVAVAGTHGKTTTTAMIVWAGLQLKLPVAYIVGTKLGFAPSGTYHVGDRYFVYEADEYDRNFLKYYPWLVVIPAVSYDHPDIYPTREDYEGAFLQFESQCEKVIKKTKNGVKWRNIGQPMYGAEDFHLAGAVRREDAMLASEAVFLMMDDVGADGEDALVESQKVIEVMDKFPGAGRRFEKIADGIYTDYAHHPEEIATTVEMAIEQTKLDGRRGVVVVYQPHQNARQHEVRGGYAKVFDGAKRVIWLPTYLTREDPTLEILTPEELSRGVKNVEVRELDDALFDEIIKARDDGYMVVLMTAGPADEWLRKKLKKH